MAAEEGAAAGGEAAEEAAEAAVAAEEGAAVAEEGAAVDAVEAADSGPRFPVSVLRQAMPNRSSSRGAAKE